MYRRAFIALFILAALGSAAALLYSTDEHAAFADEIVERCSEYEEIGLRRPCYEREVPLLELPMSDAFDVVTRIQERDPAYKWTHNMGHLLSEQEYYRDPSKWEEILRQCPTGRFSNGCPHGVMQTHFRTDALDEDQLATIRQELETLCENRDGWTPLQRASCYHGIGHSSLFLTGAAIPRSLALCDDVAERLDSDFRLTCYEGIFMQLFEPRQPEDFALIYDLVPDKSVRQTCEHITDPEAKGACWEDGWRGELVSFCGSFDGIARQACFGEGWIIADKERLETAAGMSEFCGAHFSSEAQPYCYNKLIYSLMSRLEFDDEHVRSVCSDFSSERWRGACFAHTASRLIETNPAWADRALLVCREAQTEGVGERCFDELAHYASFAVAPDSPHHETLVAGIPDDFIDER